MKRTFKEAGKNKSNHPQEKGEGVGYIRVSTDLQDVGKQRDIIKNWFRREKIKLYRFVEADAMSSRMSEEKRKSEFLNSMNKNDILVCTELSRLTRSLAELERMVSDLIKRGVRIVFISNGLDFKDFSNYMTKFALQMMGAFAEMERNIISQRTKDALRVLKEWGKNDFSYSAQSRVLGLSKSGLIRYVRTRKILRGLFASLWVSLILPFIKPRRKYRR